MACVIDALNNELVRLMGNSTDRKAAFAGYLEQLEEIQNSIRSNVSRNIRMTVEVRKEKIEKVKDEEGWKLYEKETGYVQGKTTNYYGALEKVLRKIVGPEVVTEVSGLMLEDVYKGDLKKIIPGDYDPNTNTIRLAEKPGLAEIEYAVQEGLEYVALEVYKIEAETIEDKMKVLEEFIEMNKAKVVAKVLESVEKVNGTHSLTHELVHAGAYNFMRKNENHPATQRINELYQEAMNQKDNIQQMMRTGDIVSTYWQKNVDEFLAEALSNPELIYALSNIKTVGKEKLSKGLLYELVQTLLSMLNLNKKTEENILEFTMDGFAAIIEAQSVQNNVPIDPELKALLKDKLGTIHLKDRANIEAKYVDKLKEC